MLLNYPIRTYAPPLWQQRRGNASVDCRRAGAGDSVSRVLAAPRDLIIVLLPERTRTNPRESQYLRPRSHL
jgi:hypothetical protein